MILIIMGVSGCGKTTIGKLLAEKIECQFVDADDYHPQENKEKMRMGIPLTDEDRKSWLDILNSVIQRCYYQQLSIVLACSALKKIYRENLLRNVKSKDMICFIYLKASFELIRDRLRMRRDHFMNPELLKSQFDILEEPDENETFITVSIDDNPSSVVEMIIVQILK